MKPNVIKSIKALEILDSKSTPTLSVRVELTNGIKASASVPSGTSTGRYEAFEMRDNVARRYFGKGVQKSVLIIEKMIAKKLTGQDVTNQQNIDKHLLKLDSTKNKKKLGANTILGVSLACARAASYCLKIPLFQHIRKIFGGKPRNFQLPLPMFNMLNGGLHANSGMDIQEFLLIVNKGRFSENLQIASETFSNLQAILKLKGLDTSVGLEGGFAPKLQNSKTAIELLLEAANKTGIDPQKVKIGLDVAASNLFSPSKGGCYVFRREKATFSRDQLIAWYSELASSFSLLSIEDGLEEDDWNGWQKMNKRLGNKIKIIGDDLVVTNLDRLKKAIRHQALNGIIIKPNQIGTLTETLQTIDLAKKHNLSLVISHRSGDTNDPFIADLSVAVNADFIKSGAPNRGERVAKYNRLLEIEKYLSN